MKNYKRNSGSKIEKMIKEIIADHDKYKNSYNWTINANAQKRARQEFDFDFKFMFNGNVYTVNQSLTLSCKNAYYKLSVYVNDAKKDIRALKSLIK